MWFWLVKLKQRVCLQPDSKIESSVLCERNEKEFFLIAEPCKMQFHCMLNKALTYA